MKKIYSSKVVIRAIAILLAVVMVITLLPPSSYVKAGEIPAPSGTDIALKATATANAEHSNWGILATNMNNGHVPTSSASAGGSWHDYDTASADGTSWVQYDWDKNVTINSMSIYWMCDGTWADRIPQSAKVEYKDESGAWLTVGTYDAEVMAAQEKDQYNTLAFDKEITTKCIRMTMVRNTGDNFCSIHRWQVWGMYTPVEISTTATATANAEHSDWGIVATNLNNGHAITSSAIPDESWHDYGITSTDNTSWVQYDWESDVTIDYMSVYWMCDGNWEERIPKSAKVEYKDANDVWQIAATYNAAVMEAQVKDQYNKLALDKEITTKCIRMTMERNTDNFCSIHSWQVWGQGPATPEEPLSDVPVITKTTDGYKMVNKYFIVETGKYGQITSIQLQGDKFPTNYVMNEKNYSALNTAGHQWLGELMFNVKVGDATEYSEQNTSRSDTGRKVELIDNKIVVTYENATGEKSIKDFKVIETYSMVEDKLHWEITVTNTNETKLTIGDFGIPMTFNERWPGGEEIYETRTLDHTFIGKQSSYAYVTRPSGLGMYLLMTPESSTGAGFEYLDIWRTDERTADDERAWCSSDAWSGLDVAYIHSDNIKKTNRGYLENTSLELAPGASKTYAFNFSGVDDEADMRSTIYNEGNIDAVAVPGMAYSINMPGKLYLHTAVSASAISFDIQCPHENGLHEGNEKTVHNNIAECNKDKEDISFVETVMVDGEQYHIYNIKFGDLGQNNVIVKDSVSGETKTVLQFYMMDDVAAALTTHSNFMVEHTQFNTPLEVSDKIFDDWMMDTKNKRAETDPTYWQKNYWGWGDDWALTHGEYIAEKNVYQPLEKEIKAVDEYLDIAIWNGLMREHQKDYMIHDFLMEAPNSSPTYRGYAYPHIYNTYFSMYKIASKYPGMIEYAEDATTYLLRAYNILKALYGSTVSYNWSTGVMGELTTPDIIAALEKEGYFNEAQSVIDIMATKYKNFKDTKYPYGSEYSYDNTGEEAVYTLAKMNNTTDTEKAISMMNKINSKTRACRGLQPIWYFYANPTTICDDNWWNFQYTAALAGYCMDDWLRVQDNSMTETERATASRVNYAAKLANLTCINSGQIDADPANIGTVAWTYQSEMGNLGGYGTGGGKLHNGWRQMAGESDLGLFGALQILSSDVTIDPVFGLFGYGCNVTESSGSYTVTPLDGLFTRLNFINQELYIELDRDQYTEAKVAADNTSIELSMKNLEATAHNTDVNITGLIAGSYQVSVNGTVTGSFQSVDGKTSTVTLPLPKAATAQVVITAGAALANKAPVVTLAESITVAISDKVRLEASATDDGYVNSTLTYQWEEVTSVTGGAIATPTKHITNVTFNEVGDYEFEFTADDGDLSTTKQITVHVTENSVLPVTIANYTFEATIGTNKLSVASNTSLESADFDDNSVLVDGKDGKGVQYTGKISGGYVELPETLTKNLTKATIAMDVKLTNNQSNKTTLFELGDNVVVEFIDGNVVSMTVNDKQVSTEVEFATDFWKNVELTADGDDYVLYINGVKKAELMDTGLVLASIDTETERYLIGRSKAEADPFLKGIVDNFVVKSIVMTAEQLYTTYGNEDHAIIDSKTSSVVTKVGEAPVLPAKVNALFSDGVYEKYDAVWDAVAPESYAKAGTFIVNGKLKDTDISISVKVIVVAGTLQNVAAEAIPSAIYNNPSDGGGVNALNNGFDPTNSADTSHLVWHNWNGNQGAPAWVQYNWDQEQIIDSMDTYFFKDGNGNFAPANYSIEYMNEEGNWCSVTNPAGLGVLTNQYNKTTFDPVVTKGIRMTLNPATLGSGVLEWKVYGYKEGAAIDKALLNAAIANAEGLKGSLFSSGMEAVQVALTAAKLVAAEKGCTQKEIDSAALKLNTAIYYLTPVIARNIAYMASVSTSYTSPWEKSSSVNDGAVSTVSNSSECSHWGTWGNASASESVTYTWGLPIKISSSDLYIWTDGGGIKVPTKYVYEYLDQDGSWKEVTNAVGYEIEKIRTTDPEEVPNLNGFNTTTFDEVTTTALRVTLTKVAEDGEGVGLVEWRVFGDKIAKASMPIIETNPEDTTEVANDDIVFVKLSSSVTGSAISATGSAIYYTLDGSDPTTESYLYTGVFDVKTTEASGESLVLKAIEVISGYMNSDVTEKEITFLAVPGVVSVPTIVTNPDDTTKVANDGTVIVKLISSVSGAALSVTGSAIYYTLDGSEPTTASNLYNGEFSIVTTQKAGLTLVIKAFEVIPGWIDSNVVEKSITFLATPSIPTPVLSVPKIITDPVDTTKVANNGSVKVKLSSSQTGSSIYYTVDGSIPTAKSNLYTGEFSVKATKSAGETIVIKAFEKMDGFLDSDVVTKEIIFIAAPTPTPSPSTPGSGSSATPTPTPTQSPDIETVKEDSNKASATLSVKTDKETTNISVKLDTEQLKKQLDGTADTKKEIEIPIITDNLIKETMNSGVDKVSISVAIPKDILENDNLDNANIKLPKELLETAKEKNIDVLVTAKDETGKELYSWSFDAKGLANSGNKMTDVNLSLSVEKVTEQAVLGDLLSTTTNIQNGLIISFNQDGILPSQATVKIYVGNLVDARNNTINLYHYNPVTNKLETLPYSSHYAVDSNGYVTVNILHCSEYVVLTKPADAKVVVSLLDQITVTSKKKSLTVGATKNSVTNIVVEVPTTLEVVSSLKEETSASAVGAVTITYTSSNDKVAKVDRKGKITAVKAGTVTIYTKIKLYSNKYKVVKTKITVKKVTTKSK